MKCSFCGDEGARLCPISDVLSVRCSACGHIEPFYDGTPTEIVWGTPSTHGAENEACDYM
jgi:hypothetical protein